MLVVPLGVIGALLAATLRGLNNDVYFQGGLTDRHRTVGQKRHTDRGICQGSDGEGRQKAARSHFKSGTYAFTTNTDNLVGLHPRRITAGDLHRCRLRLVNVVGTGVMGGMVTATLLAIFFVPVFFVVERLLFGKKSYQDELEHGHPVETRRCCRKHAVVIP